MMTKQNLCLVVIDPLESLDVCVESGWEFNNASRR